MSVLYNNATALDFETFIRATLNSVGATIHSIDLIPSSENLIPSLEKKKSDDYMILLHVTLGDLDTWTLSVTDTDAFETLEKNYKNNLVPEDLLKKFGKYLCSNNSHAYECDKCHEPIGEPSYKDIKKSKESIEKHLVNICKNCTHIRTVSHNMNHILEEGTCNCFVCHFCANHVINEKYHICRRCANMNSYYLCQKCYSDDPSNSSRTFKVRYERKAKPVTIQELYHELSCEKSWWPEYNFQSVMKKYL